MVDFSKAKKKDANNEKVILLTQQEKALVLSRTDKQLLEIVKNYDPEEYSKEVLEGAKQKLEEKGYDLENL